MKWLQTPTLDDFAASYPAQAAADHLGGVASIHCNVTSSGTLVDCHVLSENPVGAGFGQAALSLAPKLRLTVDADTPTGITLPLRFEPPIRRAEPIFKTDRSYDWLGVAGPYYPDRAAQTGLGGQATIECILGAKGSLERCRVLTETPANQDFGNAAMVMARRGWLTAVPRIVSGQPLSQETVDIVVPFAVRKR